MLFGFSGNDLDHSPAKLAVPLAAAWFVCAFCGHHENPVEETSLREKHQTQVFLSDPYCRLPYVTL